MAPTLLINFENEAEYFYPGQIIQGIVTLHNDAEVKVKGLTITFFGEIDVYWTEAEARTDTISPYRNQTQDVRPVRRHVHKEFRNQQTILCDEILLLGQEEAEGGADFILARGVTKYPFHYQLPFTGLPSTFTESPFGSIRYTAEARLKRPLFRYNKVEKDFVVKGIVDIGSLPRTMQPIGAIKRAEFGWICCPDGYMTLEMQLPKTGYVPNESINVRFSVVNSSRTMAHQINATLKQDVEFRTFDKTKRVTSDLRQVTFETFVAPHGVADYSESLVIPSWVQPSTLAGPRIISFHYYIQVSVNVSGKIYKVTCPVFIGSETCDILHAFALTSTQTVSLVDNLPVASTSASRDANENTIIKISKEYNPALNPFLNSDNDGCPNVPHYGKGIKVIEDEDSDGFRD